MNALIFMDIKVGVSWLLFGLCESQ